MENSAVTLELIDAIGDAFNSNDIEKIMPYFQPDAVYNHAAGPDQHGVRIERAEAIRAAFSGLFNATESVHWETLYTGFVGNKVYCEYHRVAKLQSGEEQDFNSVDILTFKNGKIAKKDTYFKTRNPS